MESAEKHQAAVLAAPSRTALIEIDEGGNALAIHPAASFMQLLTPQVYSRKQFDEIAKSKQEPHASQLHLLKGSPLNLRVGGPGDAGLIKTMIGMLPKPKVKGPLTPFDEAQW